MNILIVYGTRPEYIKISPLIKLLSQQKVINYKTVFTGQHNTLINEEADITFEIDEGLDNRLDNIVFKIMSNFNNINENFTHILVQGDTTSAFAFALAGFHRNIPIIHLEAGLRTYDNDPYPEEVNRRMISNIASIHFCPTINNFQNLINENILGKKYIVGNTSIDNIKKYDIKSSNENIILVTLHRRENHKYIENYFKIINELAEKYDQYRFILPIHPNPLVYKHKHLLSEVNVTKPLENKDLVELIAKSRLVITDSGGIQEECSYFKKRVIICRDTTERQEVLENFGVLCNHTNLKNIFEIEMRNNDNLSEFPCPFGNGNSAKKIYNYLCML